MAMKKVYCALVLKGTSWTGIEVGGNGRYTTDNREEAHNAAMRYTKKNGEDVVLMVSETLYRTTTPPVEEVRYE